MTTFAKSIKKKKKVEKDTAFVEASLFTLAEVVFFLRTQGWGKKRLEDFVHGFMLNVHDTLIEEKSPTLQELVDVVEAETGFNLIRAVIDFATMQKAMYTLDEQKNRRYG